MGISDFEADGEGLVCCTPAGFSDHGWIGIDPNDAALRAHPLGQAKHLMPEPAPHVKHLIARRNRADVEHALLDLLDEGTAVSEIQPAERCFGAS